MSVNRTLGMVSGMDTEKLVTDLTKTEQARIDRVGQSAQLASWKQDAYRDAITKINEFQSSFFNVAKGDNNIRSQTYFSKFSSSVQVDGVDSSIVSVTGLGSVQTLNRSINSITQLATADVWNGAALNLSGIKTGDLTTDFATGKPPTFNVSMAIDGTLKTISVDMSAINNKEDFVTALNTQIQGAFGSNYTNVASTNGTGIKFDKAGASINLFTVTGSSDAFTWTGLSNGASNKGYLDAAIKDTLNISTADLSTMTINGKTLASLGLTETSTLNTLVSTINGNSDIGASIDFNSLQGKFTLQARSQGAANNLSLSADLITKLGLTGTHTVGQDAMLSIDGVSVVKSSNNFTMDGINYTLNKTYTPGVGQGDIKVGMKVDTDAVIKKVQTFVDAYNSLIKTLGDKLVEKKYKDYKPLTDLQKKAMTADDIKLWETKAKSGILNGSTEISSFLQTMRRSFDDSITGLNVNLEKMGISKSSAYQDNGKLEINATVLKDTLSNNFDQFVKAFTTSSDKAYLDATNKTERYNESGIGNRLSDAVGDMVRLTTDTSSPKPQKGRLLELAGMEGDRTYSDNLITKQLTKYAAQLVDLTTKLQDHQSRYYNQFAKMETALSKMNTQSSWITSNMGG